MLFNGWIDYNCFIICTRRVQISIEEANIEHWFWLKWSLISLNIPFLLLTILYLLQISCFLTLTSLQKFLLFFRTPRILFFLTTRINRLQPPLDTRKDSLAGLFFPFFREFNLTLDRNFRPFLKVSNLSRPLASWGINRLTNPLLFWIGVYSWGFLDSFSWTTILCALLARMVSC